MSGIISDTEVEPCLSGADGRLAWAHEVETPAFVLDARVLERALADADVARRETGARILYAMKPLALREALVGMRDRLDGFAASSLFEAMLAREVLGGRGVLSITSPGLREGEIERLAGLCDHVVLNSLSQWERFGSRLSGRTSVGLRVNPGLSFLEDARYDPCRWRSKLGVPLTALEQRLSGAPEALIGVEGIHFHTHCHAESFAPLLQTVQRLVERLDPLLRSMRWINLGGGYQIPSTAPGSGGAKSGEVESPAEPRTAEIDAPKARREPRPPRPDRSPGPLYEAVGLLRERYGVEVLLEPGAALVREAGFLVATVTDLFESDGATIAVLDTTVNHAPEVFEYQFEPEVSGHASRHPCAYVLAGASCLAGDVFGEYRFAAPLDIGSRVVFPNMGAYTRPKAQMFNGINLPNLYTITACGTLHLRRRFDYADYLARLG